MGEAYELGFTAPKMDLSDYEVEFDDEVPNWVDGVLARNGPGKFEMNGIQVDNWFDGWAMLRSYEITGAENTVSVSNQYLESDVYEDAKNGHSSFSSSDGIRDTLRDIAFMAQNGPPDNANVNVEQIGEEYVALTEAPGWREFDLETLETGERYTFDDDITTHLATGHLHYDAEQGEHIGYGVKFGLDAPYLDRFLPDHEYVLYRIPDGKQEREPITRIETGKPSYLHSIGLTENYAILTEIPFTINPRKLVLSADGFLDQFNWEPEDGTTFTVVDRENGDIALQETTESFVMFHHANANEDRENGTLNVDLIKFEDDSIFEDIGLDAMKNDGHVDGGTLTRYELPHPDHDTTGTEIDSYDIAEDMAFPQINPEKHMDEHQYVYGRTLEHDDGIGLIKADTVSRQTDTWYEPDVYAEEPVFVPKPDGETEDDGIVLTSALDTAEDTSMLLALDGETLDEEARAYLPTDIPFGFHGQFFPDQ